MTELPDSFFRGVFDAAPEGIAICDARAPDHPVVYVNAAFERLTGYPAEAVIGNNQRMLQGTDTEQEGRRRLRDAIAAGTSCRILIRNYRKDGGLIWNEIFLQPMSGADGGISHYAAFYRDVSERQKAPERSIDGVPTWLREDRVSGMSSRQWFDELLRREWSLARREARPLTLIFFDIDGLGDYNDTFGRAAADTCIRRVARTIANAFRRGADVIGRWDNGCIAVLAAQPVVPASPGIAVYTETVAQRVAEMHIHNPRGTVQKFITVSAGLATAAPAREADGSEGLVTAAQAALTRAKRECRGLVVAAQPSDFPEA
jgi:diguanylate cyclase (GGDEF)-like protein/PAS domain S-box-containing protein